MITYKKHVVSVVLVMLFATSLLVPVPTTSAVFRQSITDVEAPSAVDPGESFTVSIRVHYDFTGEGEVTIFARVRDASTGGGVAIGSGGSRQVQGAGDVTWDFQAVARNTPGLWSLEAYVIRQKGAQEVEDDRRGFTITVKEPAASFDFSVKVSPSIVTMMPGEPASPTVTVGLVSGSAQEVSLTYMIPAVAGPDPRISASISPTKGTPPFTCTLRITTATDTPPGTYTIKVAGVSGSVQRITTFTLTIVGPGPQPQLIMTDWAVGEVWMLPSNPRPGDQVSFSAKISALSSDSAFPQTVRVHVYLDNRRILAGTVSVPREGLAVTVSAGTRWTAVAGSHTVRFTVDPADGIEYNDPDTANNSGELSFTVSQTTQPPSGFDFSITVRPEQQTLTPEGSVVYDVYVDLEAGTSEPVSLTVSGLPEDATFAFDPATENPYFQSRLTIYVPEFTAAGAPISAGTYTLEVRGEEGGLVRTTTAALVVEAAGVVTTQLPQTTTQATVTSKPTSVTTTQAATQTAGGLGGGAIFLLLLIVVVVAGAAYYVSRRRKTKPEPEPAP